MENNTCSCTSLNVVKVPETIRFEKNSSTSSHADHDNISEIDDADPRSHKDDDANVNVSERKNPAPTESPVRPVSKSNPRRLKQYLKLAILSSLAFIFAYESDLEHSIAYIKGPIMPVFVNGAVNVIPASDKGRYYTMILSGSSAVYHILIVAAHFFDGIFYLPSTRKIFQSGSEVECFLIVLSTLWWIVGTWITTSIHGVAGDGRGQFNLYFSTWLCLFTNMNLIEIWLVDAGYSSISQAVRSWPHRAPGWILIFVATLTCMLSILDIYLRFDSALEDTSHLKEKLASVKEAQWVFLILACAVSFTTAFGFSLIELFRREDYYVQNIKSSFELSLEGISLSILVVIWVSVCVIATTNGACSEVGNSYFLTWASTGVVIQTFINWLRDWRKGVHEIILQQYREYRASQAKAEGLRSDMCDDDSQEEE